MPAQTWIGLLCILGTAWTAVAGAASGASSSDSTAAEVDEVLRQESGQPADRRRKLADFLERQPDSTAARWQAGYVRDGKTWQAIETPLASAADLRTLEEYHQMRAAQPRTPDAHWKLANWCRKNHLLDQERAHLHTVLALAPDRDATPILRRLGYRQVSGQWVAQNELHDWRELNHRAETALKLWGPQLNRLSRQLEKTARREQTEEAAKQAFADPEAIPALELILAGKNEPTALLVVEILREIETWEAALALARQAVFSTWPKVRTTAAAALVSRKPEDFVPPLIDLLATPVQMQVQISQNRSRGTLFYSYLLARETDNQFQVAQFQRARFVIGAPPAVALIPGGGLAVTRAARAQNDQERAMEDELYLRERQVTQQNERTDELNLRIGATLAIVSGKQPTSDPQQWWQWWAEHNEVQRSENKRVVRVSEQESSAIRVGGVPTSCFVAGTPVWTESGLQPIEKIQSGDRVLSKDVETGELAYRTVLQTTVRPPHAVFEIDVGGERLEATGGHRFWISGQGWVKARDLQPEMPVHTATGSVPVRTVATAAAAPTYNLVVEGVHNYFVGTAALLTHDVTLPRPTNRLVPGFASSAPEHK